MQYTVVSKVRNDCRSLNHSLLLIVEECLQCHRNNKRKTVATEMYPTIIKEAPSVLGVNFIGPLPATLTVRQ